MQKSWQLSMQCVLLAFFPILVNADEELLVTRFNPCLNKISSLVSDIDSKIDVVESLVEITDECAAIQIFGPGPVTISLPGSYCLAQDVNTITITASQVTLNLNGHTVSSATTGITISGLSPSNIIIRNGFIKATNANTGTGISIASGGNGIFLDKISINNWQIGINASNINNTVIHDCLISNSDGVGIQLANISNVQIQKSLFSGNAKGLLLADTSSTSKGLKVTDTAFQQTQTANNAVDIQSGDSFEFIGCSAIGNANRFSGFSFANVANSTIKDCFATGFSDNSAVLGNGFLMNAVSNGSIINCIAKKNVTGFLVINGSSCITRESVASNNNTGFSWDGTGDGQFYTNMACENSVQNFTPTITQAPVTSPANAMGADNIDCDNSDIDQIDAIESIVENIASTVDVIESLVESGSTSSSALDFISSQEAVIDSKIDACCKLTQSKLDSISSQTELIESLIESGSTSSSALDAISSKELVIESKVDACCSSTQSLLLIIESIVESSAINFDCSLTDTLASCSVPDQLDEIQSTVDVIDSKADYCCQIINSKLAILESMLDLLLTRTF